MSEGKLRTGGFALALAGTFGLVYYLCILWDYGFPDRAMRGVWQGLFPGFAWTQEGVIVGFLESLLYGLGIGLIFGALYNFAPSQGVSIARKNLLAEKTRLAISVGGVAFAVLLILVLQGLYQGWDRRMGVYIEQTPADIWVAQEGADDMFHSMSLLPANLQERSEKIDGVAEVHPLHSRRYAFNIEGEEALTVILGYHAEEGVGGPLEMVEGESIPGPGEIIIDRAFANKYDLHLGDILTMEDKDLRIVGISEGTDFLLYQYSFVAETEAQALFQMGDFVNYFLIRLEDAGEVDTVTDLIEAEFAGVQAFSREEFADTSRQLLEEYFIPVLAVLFAIGFAIGVAVIGLTTYTATIEKSREYGILKAIGAKNSDLYRILFEQGMIVGLLGFGVGAALSLVVNQAAAKVVPEFLTSIEPLDMSWVLGASLLMSLLASYIPMRRLAGIDPALVFKS